MNCVGVPQLDKLKLLEDHRVNDSQLVIDCPVKDHVIDCLANLLCGLADPIDSVDVDVFKELVDLLYSGKFLNQLSEEIDELWILVVDAQEKAVEDAEWVCLYVA